MNWPRFLILPRGGNSLSDVLKNDNIKAMVRAWLSGRALVLPDSARLLLSQQLGIPETKIADVEHALQAQALRALDTL